MKNKLACLIEAYYDFRNDINLLIQDIQYIITNKLKWTYFETKNIEKGCFYNSFYNENSLLYILIDLTDDVPYLQISLFHILDEENDGDEEVGISYLEEHWKNIDPRSFLYNLNYEIIKTKNGFKVIIDNKEKYVFSGNIDLLSITSSNIVEKDITELINSLISSNYESYFPKNILFVEPEDK